MFTKPLTSFTFKTIFSKNKVWVVDATTVQRSLIPLPQFLKLPNLPLSIKLRADNLNLSMLHLLLKTCGIKNPTGRITQVLFHKDTLLKLVLKLGKTTLYITGSNFIFNRGEVPMENTST